MIPVAKPDVTEAESLAVDQVLKSGWLTQGPKAIEFERKLAAYTGARSMYCVSSCTTGLFLALRSLGIGPGDEVIVPSYSFIATANSVSHTGAIPVFADIRPDDFNLDVNSARAAISSKTKAILLVHQLGMPADIDAFSQLARERNLLLVEDAACAIGSTYKDKRIGAHSDLVVFSFHPRKILTTGEGGAIAYNGDDPKVSKFLEIGRKHGMSVNDLERHQSHKIIFETYPVIGFNFRMTDMQAAVGIVQLERLPDMLARRRKIVTRYQQAFGDRRGIIVPRDPQYGQTNFQTFMLRVTSEARIGRDDLMAKLLEDGIATRRGIMMSHAEECYCGHSGVGRVSLKNTIQAASENVILPLFNTMTSDEVNQVIEAVLKYI